MKSYLVATFDLPLAPLIHNGYKCTLLGMVLLDCDDLAEAQSHALRAMLSRDRANIFRRRKDGRLERIEHYQRPLDEPGPVQRYVRNRRDRNFSWPQNTAGQVRDKIPAAYGHAPFF